ncbi:MAG TPA: methyltransferase domain-containing protein [Acidimicrobiales bacterium]|nr:methyltransferase domain-containing protein [Acidimicrobiales bacterium]
MPDAHYELPRLARVYDAVEGERPDLEVYAALAEQLGAHRVLDVGCGTGTLACLLARRGLEVVALDPAAASIALARRKDGADRVRFLLGDVSELPPVSADLATMTGNVAQVFCSDEGWASALAAIRGALVPGGHLVFETREPRREAWLEWTAEASRVRREVPGEGAVEYSVEVTAVDGRLVSFRSTYRFESDGAVMTSDSTICFRSRPEVEASLEAAGLDLVEVREAPDRPGREMVFLARRPA